MIFLLLAISLLQTASAQPENLKAKLAQCQKEDRAEVQSCQKCVSAGGRWGHWGLTPFGKCDTHYSDGGKACTDSADCQGKACTVPGPPGAKAPSSGQCIEWSGDFIGCKRYFNKGAITTVCAD